MVMDDSVLLCITASTGESGGCFLAAVEQIKWSCCLYEELKPRFQLQEFFRDASRTVTQLLCVINSI